MIFFELVQHCAFGVSVVGSVLLALLGCAAVVFVYDSHVFLVEGWVAGEVLRSYDLLDYRAAT